MSKKTDVGKMIALKVQPENYYIVYGWMIKVFGLKGPIKEVFAIIFAFTKDGVSEFHGSWAYLQAWLTGVSGPTINKALKFLVDEKHLLTKIEVPGEKTPRYKVNFDTLKKFNVDVKFFNEVDTKNLSKGGKKILDNNIITDMYINDIETIINYLNEKTGKKFSSKNASNQVFIATRLSEGYSVEECKTVINNMCNVWLNDKYTNGLNPKKLFGDNFETYLNWTNKKQTHGYGEVGRSFDADDFFEAALSRSLREMGLSYGSGDQTNENSD